MSRIDRVRVVVPARDEERLVGRCLESVQRAVADLAAAHPGLRCTVTVVELDEGVTVTRVFALP